MEVWAEILRARAVVGREVNAKLHAQGMVSVEELEALSALNTAGGTLRHHELADQIALTRSGITRLVARLTDRGLVERITNAQDRRAQSVRLTPLGRSEREWAWPIYQTAIEEALKSVPLNLSQK